MKATCDPKSSRGLHLQRASFNGGVAAGILRFSSCRLSISEPNIQSPFGSAVLNHLSFVRGLVDCQVARIRDVSSDIVVVTIALGAVIGLARE